MHVHPMCARSCGGQKEVSALLELELQFFMSHHVGAGNPTKISKIFTILWQGIWVSNPTHCYIITLHKSLVNPEKPALDAPKR